MRKTWAVINIVALLVMLALNLSANIIPLNNISTAAVSDKYSNLFTPAGITFAIWGLIYVALMAFTVYLTWTVFSKKAKNQKVIDAVGPWFALSSILNALWIVAWHYDKITLTVVLMAGLLISLICLYVNLRATVKKPKRNEYWLVLAPISLYLGWISVATIANVSALLTKISWSAWGIGASYWTVLMIVVGLVLALLMIAIYRDYVYAGVIVWAYIGIIINRVAHPLASTAGIAATAGLCIVALLIISWAASRKQIT